MKKNYSSLILSLLLSFSTNMLFAQAGWTVYDHTNSALADVSAYKAVAIDASGNVWAGGDYSGLFKFNGTTWTKFSKSNSNILHDDINDIVIDNTGKIWAANYKGISVYNGTTFTNYDTVNAGFNGETVYTLGKDNNGKIWLASKNGSFGYKGITTYDGSVWASPNGYPSQIVNAEFPDFAFTPTNTAWIACSGGVTKHSGTFTFYPKAATGLWSSQSIAVDASGTMWAGGFDGLLKYDGATWTFYDNVTHFGFTSNTFFYDILPDGNILWIATAKGLLKFDRTTSKVLANYNKSNSPLEDNGVVQIAKDASGNIWLATTVGIVKMVPSQVGAVKEEDNYQVGIYPNPFNTQTTLKTNKFLKDATLTVYNLNGQAVKQMENLSGQTIVFDRDNLPAGLYFFSIKQDNKTIVADKLVIADN